MRFIFTLCQKMDYCKDRTRGLISQMLWKEHSYLPRMIRRIIEIKIEKSRRLDDPIINTIKLKMKICYTMNASSFRVWIEAWVRLLGQLQQYRQANARWRAYKWAKKFLSRSGCFNQILVHYYLYWGKSIIKLSISTLACENLFRCCKLNTGSRRSFQKILVIID